MPSIALPEATAAPTLDLSAYGLRARIDSAMGIRDRLRAQPGYQPLRGCHLAMLSSTAEPQAATPLRSAATALGAQVAQVRHWPNGNRGDDAEMLRLGRTLGLLYDAVDCPALAPRTLALLRQSAGVPVYDGLDGESHPLRALAELMLLLERPHLRDASLPTVRVQRLDSAAPHVRTFIAGALALGLAVFDEEGDGAPVLILGMQGLSWSDGRHDAALDPACRSANHHALIQALLIETIGKA